MAIDIRATVSCNLGTVISGSIADDYLQGSGLIKTRGQVVLKGTLTPKIGRGVTFTYTKNGTTRSIPRKLRVLSSFADPFRKITTVQLGCKLTYLSDLAEPVKETIAEQIPAVVYEELKTAISAPLKASGILDKCLEKLGLTAASNPLQNRFIAEEWDLSPGYVQVMNDLLVSESYFGYLDEDEELQIRDLTDDAGRGKLIEADDIVDLSPIGAGNLPGEAVIVNYSFRRLGSGSSTNEDQLVIQDPAEEQNVNPEDLPEEEKVKYKRSWEFSESIGGVTSHAIAYTSQDGEEKELVTKYVPYSKTYTFYDEQNRVYEQWDETRTIGAEALGGMISEFLQAGLIGTAANSASQYLWEGKYTYYEYNDIGKKVAQRVESRISDAAMLGRLNAQAVYYYADGTPWPLTFDDVGGGGGIDYDLAEVQQTFYYATEEAVKTVTYNYQAWGLTQEGQQAFSRQNGIWATSGDFIDYFDSNAFALVPVPGLTTLSINRGQLVPQPRPAELAKAVPLTFPMDVPDEPGGGVTIETATSTLYALGSAESERVVQLTMPVAPDDYWDTNYWNENVAVAYPVVLTKKKSSAQQNAIKYGRVQNRLLLGNRNGISLQLAPERLPKRPFDPLYVKAGGITASYRVNGASWTFDANGIVASVDALLWGAVGADAGTDLASSWIPLAPDTATLPTPPAVITPVTPEEVANAPEIQPVAVLPPYIETVPLEAVSHTTASIVVYNHLLTTETETLSLITRTVATVQAVFGYVARLEIKVGLGDVQVTYPGAENITRTLTTQTSITPQVVKYEAPLAVFGHTTTPFITFMRIYAGTVQKLANPASLPSVRCADVAVSPDGSLVAFLQTSSPYLGLYTNSNYTFTKEAAPTAQPDGSGQLEFSPGGNYLFTKQTFTSPYYKLYRVLGTTFQAITGGLDVTPTSGIQGFAFSPDDALLAVTYGTTLRIYRRQGDAFTSVTSVTLAGSGGQVSWAPDQAYLAVGISTAPYVALYAFNGTTLTAVTGAISTPSTTMGLAFSPVGNYLAISHNTSPYLSFYKRNGSSFTALTTGMPTSSGTAYARSIGWTGYGDYFVLNTSTPAVRVWKVTPATDTFTEQTGVPSIAGAPYDNNSMALLPWPTPVRTPAQGATTTIATSIEPSVVSFDPNDPLAFLASNALPRLGASSATSTTGWTTLYNGNVDDAFTSQVTLPFNVTISSTSSNAAFISSNSFLTFGAGSDVYTPDATFPELLKLLVAAYDYSYQAVYTKAGTGFVLLRYEGFNSASGTTAGSSNIIWEVALLAPHPTTGAQVIELRIGNHAGSLANGVLLCDTTTELTSAVPASELTSYIFQGNATGTSWTVTANASLVSI